MKAPHNKSSTDQTDTTHPTLRKIFCVAGGKGGVGKTTTALALIDQLRKLGKTLVVIETDTSNPDVAKVCEKLEGLQCALLDLDEADGWIELLNMLEQQPHATFVINTASRNNLAVRKFASLLTSSLEALATELVVFWVINRQRDSLELLREFLETVPVARVHVVRNAYYGETPAKFELYNTSKLRKEIETQGLSLDFPDLADRVADALTTDRLPIEVAEKAFPIGNRAELLRWRAEVSKMFAQALA